MSALIMILAIAVFAPLLARQWQRAIAADLRRWRARQTFACKLAQFSRSVEALAVEIGTALLPAMRRAVQATNEFATIYSRAASRTAEGNRSE